MRPIQHITHNPHFTKRAALITQLKHIPPQRHGHQVWAHPKQNFERCSI
jgi:hypothetical protein